MTTKQKDRQSYRSKGKYSVVNPCYACGKSAGVDFSSHPLTDTGEWGDVALCLCHKCWTATSEFKNPEDFLKYKEQFGDAAEEAWEKVRE